MSSIVAELQYAVGIDCALCCLDRCVGLDFQLVHLWKTVAEQLVLTGSNFALWDRDFALDWSPPRVARAHRNEQFADKLVDSKLTERREYLMNYFTSTESALR